MKKKVILLALILLLAKTSFSQIEDILKKIPVIGDAFDRAVTTSIKDAYPTAYWLRSLDKQMAAQTDQGFSPDLSPGYYRFTFRTFCLQSGTYEPTEGSGYLVAPLKGSKAELINNILTKYQDHTDIDQKDVQSLIWGIEAGQKFSSYPPDFQLRVQPLLTPEDIAKMEVDVKQIANDLMPQEVRDALNLYGNIRDKLSDVNSTYEDVEKLAVKTGIFPKGKPLKNIEEGSWTSIGGGAYLRCFPNSYRKSDVEIYIPPEVKIQKDNNGNIVSLDDDTYKIEFQYESGSSVFKNAAIKNHFTGQQSEFDNNASDNASIKNQADEFINLVKKSFGKRKSKTIQGELKTLSQLKAIELSLSNMDDKNGYASVVNSVNGFVCSLEQGNKKGGGRSNQGGLNNISGLVFAPAYTVVQRLGNGGDGGKKDKCHSEITLHRVNPDYLPEPGTNFNVTIDIVTDVECRVEGVRYTLYDVSRERGRCINDKDPNWYDSRLDFFIDPNLNQSLNVSADSLTAETSAEVTQVTIGCNDYGAFGKLGVEVKVNGNWIVAKDEGSSTHHINLPNDADDNGIADSWEVQNNVSGLPSMWDEDPDSTGQARNGDGLTNYEEYRGCYVYDEFAGVQHIRTKPKLKEIFVIDSSNIFMSVSWEMASGIKAYYLTKDLVFGDKSGFTELQPEYKRVNFNSSFSKGNKFAVNIVKINTMEDPLGIDTSKTIWGSCELGPPKDVSRVSIYAERRRVYTIHISDSLNALLIQHPSQQTFVLGGKTFQRTYIEDFVNVCQNPQKLELLVEFLVNRTVIHEVGHACCVNHHHHISGGNADCPMKYIDNGNVADFADMLTDLFDVVQKGTYTIVIYTNWRFCKSDDNCWGKLNVNDR